MKAAFYKAKGTIVDRLIKWWTKGNYYGDGYHVFGYYSKNIGRSYRAAGFIEFLSPENKNLQPVTFSQISFQRKISDF